MPWPVDFYEDARGDAPVEQFLDSLTDKQRAKLIAVIELLKLAESDIRVGETRMADHAGRLALKSRKKGHKG